MPESPIAKPPTRDPVYQTVAALRQPGVLDDRLRKALLEAADGPPSHMQLQQVQVHYRPFKRARILARAVIRTPEAGRAGIVQFFYLQTFLSQEAARQRFATASKANPRPCYGPPVILLEGLSTIAWALPNAPRLGPSHVCFCPNKYRKFLKKNGCVKPSRKHLPEMIRYIPRKRALFYCRPTGSQTKPFYLKFYLPGHDLIATRNLASLKGALDRGKLAFVLPRLIFRCARRRAVAMEEIPGTKLTRLMLDEPGALLAVGGALASLHCSDLTPVASWDPGAEFTALQSAMRDVQRALPMVSEDLDRLLGRLERGRSTITFEDSTPIHGNLFGDQILVHDGRVGIVDWDDLCRGDPTYDLGRLTAHLIFMARRTQADRLRVGECIRSLQRGYAETAGRTLDQALLRWQTAAAILMRAKISALRVLSPEWTGETVHALEDAHEILDGRSGWLEG